MNKYLEKIAQDKLRDPDHGRMAARGALYAGASLPAAGAIAGGALSAQKALRGRLGGFIGGAGVAAGTMLPILAAKSGIAASKKNQLREQQLHDIKVQGANQRQEAHEARMRKMASERKDPNQVKKDLANVGVIAAMGGVGNTIADRVVHGAKAATGLKSFAVGTGIGLVADYAGVKINNQINKQIDKK